MNSALKIFVVIACVCISLPSVAQNKRKTQTPPPAPKVVLPPMADSIMIDPFNTEDSLSDAFGHLINNYYKYGKFEKPFDAFSGKQGKVFFQELFLPSAMVANDLGAPNEFKTQIPIAQYVNQASAKRPRNYEYFVEKGRMIVAYPDTVARNYVAEYKFFKLFADKAVYKNPYELGAIYTMKLRISLDSFDIKIEDVRIDEGNLFQNFSLGGFGFQGDSPFLLTNNLNGLIRNMKEAIDPAEYQKKDTKLAKISDSAKPKKKPKSERKRTITKSNIAVKGGLHYPEVFSPIAIPENTNEDAKIRTSQAGQQLGISYQKTVGKRDGFGWFIGVDYNRFDFKNDYENIGMTYTAPQGLPFLDAEGNAYTSRHVFVPNYTDVGYLSYVSPEFGLLFNIHLGSGAHFQLTGSVSHHTLIENVSKTTGVVSYQGQMNDGPLISQDNLGFYTNRDVEWSRPFDEFQSFVAYHAGLSLNIMMGQQMSIFIEGRYNKSMTYAIREAINKDLPFFDIDERSWKSPMNYLPESRHLQSFSVGIGFRFYFYEKR